jgi:hypothetical protein
MINVRLAILLVGLVAVLLADIAIGATAASRAIELMSAAGGVALVVALVIVITRI